MFVKLLIRGKYTVWTYLKVASSFHVWRGDIIVYDLKVARETVDGIFKSFAKCSKKKVWYEKQKGDMKKF